MRVVLDTNVLISAVWKPGGLEAQVVEHAWRGSFSLAVSEAVMAEYAEVLGRKKFAQKQVAIQQLWQKLQKHAEMFQTADTLHISKDKDDNRMLECALAAQAAYLVTGNLKDYPEALGATKVRSARMFLVEAQLTFVDSAVP
ncbi:MAG: putative toxin-antitoxin system toxin component, PIN family [Bryobacter sp.]